MAQRQTKDNTKLPMPIRAMFSQRQITVFSAVLTRMTMIGKVRNMNHRLTRKDFLNSFIIVPVLGKIYARCSYLLHLGLAHDARGPENQEDHQQGESENIFVVA
jgi:hypothetical protein